MVTLIGNTLSWQEPVDLYGETLLRFEILAAQSDNSSRAEVIHIIEPPTTSFSLDELHPLLPAGQSFVWVSMSDLKCTSAFNIVLNNKVL